MNKLLLLLSFLLLSAASFAQTGKDTIVYNLPVVNGHLLYADSINVKGRSAAQLDTAAKHWFLGYFKNYRLLKLADKKDTANFIFSEALLEYYLTPGLVPIKFFAIITLQIDCRNSNYNYKIYNIYFRPKSDFLNSVGYQNDPDYLISIYKQKHLGFGTSVVVDRKQIRNYLGHMNIEVRKCITSLNKAMAN